MKLFFPLLFCFFVLSLHSQIYSYKHFNEDAGLVHSFVYDIKQDNNGFLYIGTGNGLSVYSGYGFANYTTEKGLKENFITALYHDSKDRMWLGHFEGGVSMMTADRKVKTIPTLQENNFRVTQIVELSEGCYLFLKSGLGLILYNEKTNKVSMPDNGVFEEVTKVLLNKDELLLLKSNGVYSVKIQDLIGSKTPALEKKFALQDAADMEFNPNKTKLILVDNKTGVSVRENSSNFKILDSYAISKEESTSYTKTFVDNNDNIYLGTTDRGLFKIEPNAGLITNYTMVNGLKSNAVQSMFCDREGNLWIGLYGKGLQQMNSELFNYTLITDENHQPVSINKLIKLNNRLYAATNSGIGCNNGSKIDFVGSSGLVKKNYNNLLLYNNIVFISSEDGELFSSDTLFKNIKKIDLGINSQVLSINNLIKGKNCLYICTSGGLVKYNTELSQKTLFTTQSGLLHNNINTVFEDSKRRVWICSPGSPLHYMDTDGSIKIIELPGLKNFNINSICEDNNGNFWISTIGDGILKYNFKETKSYMVKNGLKSNYCYGVVNDRRSNIWVNHINGISYKIDTKSNFNHINNADLSGMNFIENSYYYDKPSGKLYFGAAEGFVTINTRKQKFNEVPAKINLLDIQFNERAINPATDSVFKYNGYDIAVSFVGICLTEPEKIRYRYKLEGYDEEWKYLNAETRKITYSKIKDGDYSLKIYVANNDDLWNEVPAVYNFSVGKPYWKQAWFYVMMLVVLAVLFYLCAKIYARGLIEKQKKLEEIINIKTNEISIEKGKIEVLFSELKSKNNDLTDSINYARRIQEALLPLDTYITETFNTAYLYKAKDIVSGDFYWFKKTANYSFAAAVDCTGHGVPGAFMSFIGATILDEIVNNNENLDPVQILKILDERVINILNQHSKEGDFNRDGMDLSICKYDEKSNNLQVSSAARPFYYYTNETMTRIKGSRYSVGGSFQKIDKAFELYERKVKKGDNLFLFSDGITDQMGGSKNKKYSSKRLKNFLQIIAPLDAGLQRKKMHTEFEEWQASEEQTDDVLLISIKF